MFRDKQKTKKSKTLEGFCGALYFQFTGFSTLLLYVHMLITTFLLALCQEEFICNNYAKLFKHSFIIIIIYFTKESFNRPLFFFF